VPDGARFAAERDFPAEVARTGVIHPETWLAHASGRNSLNGFNLESSSTPRAAVFMDHVNDVSVTRAALRLSRYGVTHVVATSDHFAQRLGRSPRFQAVWRSAPLTILALQPSPGSPAPASQISAVAPVVARLTHAEAEHLGFEIEAPDRTVVSLALAWSPKWHARIDGAPVSLTAARDGLIELTVPAGRRALRLDYRRDAWDRLGVVLTLITLAAGTLVLRRRRPTARSG